MIAVETLLDAFLNANILFCITYALWFVLQKSLGYLRISHAHGAHLKLLNALFIAVIIAPLIAAGFKALQSNGIASDVTVNLSDLVVSHYLNGGFDMKASSLESLLLARDTFLLNVMTGTGWLSKIFIAGFLFGLVVGVFRLLCSVAKLRRTISSSYRWRRFKRLDIHLSDNTLVPFSTRGIFRYHVVLPSHMLAHPEQLKVSLAHELQHIRQGDLEWEVLLEVMKPFFYLNPAFHAWKRQVEELREFNCDTVVLSRGHIGLRAYCDTLLSVCQRSLRGAKSLDTAMPKVTLVASGRTKAPGHRVSLVEHRIMSVLDTRDSADRNLFFSAIAAVFLFFVVVTSLSIQRPDDWSQDRLTLSTVVNLERLAEINRTAAFGQSGN